MQNQQQQTRDRQITQLDRVDRMLTALLKSKNHLEWIGGYAYGRTTDGDPFILLYPARQSLKEKHCRIYDRAFKYLPSFINTDVPASIPPSKFSPSRREAIAANNYYVTPLFEVVTHDGGDKNGMTERRFSNVTKITSIMPEGSDNPTNNQQPANNARQGHPASPASRPTAVPASRPSRPSPTAVPASRPSRPTSPSRPSPTAVPPSRPSPPSERTPVASVEPANRPTANQGTNQATPNQATPNQATPNQATPNQATPNRPTAVPAQKVGAGYTSGIKVKTKTPEEWAAELAEAKAASPTAVPGETINEPLKIACLHAKTADEFDVAMTKWVKYYGNAKTVAMARIFVFGEFDKTAVSKYEHVLRSYAARILVNGGNKTDALAYARQSWERSNVPF